MTLRPARGDDLPDGDVPFPPTERPRTAVAVIELGDFEPNRKLALDLAVELNNDRFLKPIDSSIAADALRDKHVDEDFDAIDGIDGAQAQKRKAEDAVTDYKFSEAAKAADLGLFRLHRARPTPRVLALSSDLAFLLGAARLGERNSAAANAAFRFARTLDPSFKPNAARYLDEIVRAFEAATKTVPAGKGWIGVGPVSGELFLDGRAQGTSPQTLSEIAPGTHVVWLVGSERDTNAMRVDVEPGKKVEIKFEPEPIDLRKRVKRARLLLRAAPDPAARAAAMHAVAKLLEVKDALLLTEANGKTIIQSWREGPVAFGTPGFSALREFKDKDKPVDLLSPLLPPKVIPPPRKPDPPFKPPVVVDTRSWYEKPRYQIAGGAAGVVIIGVVIYALSNLERNPFSNPEAGFETRREP